jgi:hypothetical protein
MGGSQLIFFYFSFSLFTANLISFFNFDMGGEQEKEKGNLISGRKGKK